MLSPDKMLAEAYGVQMIHPPDGTMLEIGMSGNARVINDNKGIKWVCILAVLRRDWLVLGMPNRASRKY